MKIHYLTPTTQHPAHHKMCSGHTLILNLSEEFYEYFNVDKKENRD